METIHCSRLHRCYERNFASRAFSFPYQKDRAVTVDEILQLSVVETRNAADLVVGLLAIKKFQQKLGCIALRQGRGVAQGIIVHTTNYATKYKELNEFDGI